MSKRNSYEENQQTGKHAELLTFGIKADESEYKEEHAMKKLISGLTAFVIMAVHLPVFADDYTTSDQDTADIAPSYIGGVLI